MATTAPQYMGITVTLTTGPGGEPQAQVTIEGTTADQVITVDDAGLELAFISSNGQFHVADARTVL